VSKVGEPYPRKMDSTHHVFFMSDPGHDWNLEPESK
jgi:hypothetical protein